MKLRRHNGVPLYRQMESDLIGRIDRRELAPGDRLPPEIALAREWGVNRLTVRQAIGELARAGRVTVRRGAGTFVTDPPLLVEIDLPPLPTTAAEHSSSESLAAQGRDPLTEIVSAVGPEADPVDALGPGLLTRIDTVHVTAAGLPSITSSYWLPTARFPDLAVTVTGQETVYAALRLHYDVRLRYAWRTLSAAVATGADANLLDVPAGSPLLVRAGVNVDDDGVPTLYLLRRLRGDRFTIVLRYDTRTASKTAWPTPPL